MESPGPDALPQLSAGEVGMFAEFTAPLDFTEHSAKEDAQAMMWPRQPVVADTGPGADLFPQPEVEWAPEKEEEEQEVEEEMKTAIALACEEDGVNGVILPARRDGSFSFMRAS